MICRKRLNQALDRLGYEERYIGTEYIRQGVAMVDYDRGAAMMKEVYPAIAKAASTDSRRIRAAAVERAIRSATEAAMSSPMWDREWRELGGWNHPTNAEVLHRLARECRVED